MEIYERIKYLRTQYLKLSRNKFGEELGVSQDVINNIELNRLAKPEQKEPLYKLICKVFNVNEEWLRNGGPDSDIFIEYSEDDEIAMYVQDLLDDEDDVIASDIKNFIRLYYGKMDDNSKQVLRNIHTELFSMLNKNEEQT